MQKRQSAKNLAVNEHGYVIGEDHPRARLTNGDVDLLLALREEGWGYRRLAKKFDISPSGARKICKGQMRCQSCAGHKTVHTADDDAA